jgi:hypothetical protein
VPSVEFKKGCCRIPRYPDQSITHRHIEI